MLKPAQPHNIFNCFDSKNKIPNAIPNPFEVSRKSIHSLVTFFFSCLLQYFPQCRPKFIPDCSVHHHRHCSCEELPLGNNKITLSLENASGMPLIGHVSDLFGSTQTSRLIVTHCFSEISSCQTYQDIDCRCRSYSFSKSIQALKISF